MSQTVFDTPPKAGISSITPAVAEQLKARRKLVSKKYENPNFTQSFLTGNYAWLRMVSGISIESTPDAAEKFQLLGGALYDGKKRAGFNFGESFMDDSKGAAYTFEKEGIKPMPGITGFAVENMGEEGLLRQVSVQVQCHSLEQFSIMEKLYMRPGYHTFLEWGHSCYLDRSGNEVYAPKKLDDGVLFADPCKIDDIKDECSKLIYDSQHNYDYIIAQIMNYEWSYDNGVYTLDIMLIGEGGLSKMQEQMFNLGTDKETPPGKESEKELEFNSARKLAGSFGTIMRAISEAAGRGTDPAEDLKPLPVDSSRLDDAFNAIGVKEDVDKIIEEIGDGFKLEPYRLDFLKADKNKRFVYIPLRFIMGCINYFHLPRVKGEKAPQGKFATDKDRNVYLTFKDHYSTDPFICLLPKQAGTAPFKTDDLQGERDTGELRGDLLDVWVNSHYVYQVVWSVIKSAKKDHELSIAHFLKALLDGIEGALGSINDFNLYNDFYLDKELGPSYIVDKILPHNPEGSEEAQNINISPLGKESLVTGFSFSTNVDQAMLTTLTAQAVLDGSDAAKASSKGTAAYNFGIKNRFRDSDDDQTKPADASDNTGAQKESVDEKYGEIFKKKIYNQQTIDDIKQSAATSLQIAVNDELAAKGKHTGFAIPGNLNLTMLGIGGLKRLEYFRIPYDMLPESYKTSEVIFMVDKINHDIAGGIWQTTVDAIVLKL